MKNPYRNNSQEVILTQNSDYTHPNLACQYNSNKENIPMQYKENNQQAPSIYQLQSSVLQQSKNKYQGNQINNQFDQKSSFNDYQNKRKFGRDLSNQITINHAVTPSHEINEISSNNSRCISRDISANGRKQSSFVEQTQKNVVKLNHNNLCMAGQKANVNKYNLFSLHSNGGNCMKMDIENNNVSNINKNYQIANPNFQTYFSVRPLEQQSNQNPQQVQSQINDQNKKKSQDQFQLQDFQSTISHCQQLPQSHISQNGSYPSSNQISLNNFILPSPNQRKRIILTSEEELELVDLKNVKKPEYVSQYAKEIFDYLRANEEKYICKTPYFELDKQPDLNSRMRTILIDWLIDVHLKYGLLPETLFLTTNLIDRYLEKGPKVEKSKFQLLGITALFIACKYEEIYPPDVSEFTFVCDNAYTKQELFQQEGLILQVLDFNITTPSSFRFLERYARIAEFDQRQFMIALYFLEICLVDYSGIKFTPSQLACGSIYLTNVITNKQERWNDVLIKNTKYEQIHFIPVIEQICEIHRKAELREKQTQDTDKQLNAAKRKFSQLRFEYVYNQIASFFSLNQKSGNSCTQNNNINL